jgi:hypothetical protein
LILAPIHRDLAQRTNLTGHAKLDVSMKSSPSTARVADRITGTFAFSGPHVLAAGYEARDVKVSGSIDGSRISLNGRASAYGGTATARGVVVMLAPERALGFDLRGSAEGVNLRNLPAAAGAPNLLTKLSVSSAHIAGEGQSIRGLRP